MDFKQLEAFVQVVDNKSFSKAANALYLTQPTVSAHISALEKELTTVLIIRTTKEVRPSPQGKVLYSYAKQMLDTRAKALRQLKSEQTQENRTITIAAPKVLANRALSRLIRQFSELNPSAVFEITNLNSRFAEREVQKGAAQIGFVGSKSGTAKLKYFPVFSDRLVLITPNTPKFAGLRAGEVDAELLNELRLIVENDGSGTRKEALRYLRKIGASPKLYIVEDGDAVCGAVSEGLGVALVQRLLAQEYLDSKRVLMFEPLYALKQNLYVVTHKRYELPKLARAFVRFARQSAPKLSE